ncbi:hypothetical protein QQ045_007540 [Rhodiola kirilowii]
MMTTPRPVQSLSADSAESQDIQAQHRCNSSEREKQRGPYYQIKLTAQEEVALELRASQDLWNLISCSGMPVAVNAQKEHFPDK